MLLKLVEPSLDGQACLEGFLRSVLINFFGSVDEVIAHLIIRQAEAVPEFSIFRKRMAS